MSVVSYLVATLILILGTAAQECQVAFPSQYAYKTSALQNPTADDTYNCSLSTLDGQEYTSCSHPILVTDNELGPERYDSNDNSYYLWNKDEDCQVLFTFSMEVMLTSIEFHFYINLNDSIGLPKLRVSLVDNDFQVSDTLDENVASLTLDPIEISPEQNERTSRNLNLNGEFGASTRQVLLRIDQHKRYGLALSEIRFCRAGTSVSTDSRSEAPSSSPPHRPPTADPTHANTAAPTTEPDPEMNVMDTVTDGQLASQGNLLSVSSICVLVLVVMLVLR